jgi:1,4-dihydroxy-6-naphthoate synthase
MTRITVACSPDADDLFMMRALLEGEIDTGSYRFEIDTSPTDALNRLGSGDEGPDVLALSIAHYPRVHDRYQLLPHGGSMGEGYGPVIVTPQPCALADLVGRRVGVPGLTTTAYAVLQMMIEVDPVVISITPYTRIFDALRAGEVDAGLIIHEGRLTYEEEGCHQVADIGEWWARTQDGLPLPLGGNAIRRGLGPTVTADVSGLLRESIRLGLERKEQAVQWLLERGGPLGTRERVWEYLDMYANQRTLDYGEAGRAGIRRFLTIGAQRGLFPAVDIDFAP